MFEVVYMVQCLCPYQEGSGTSLKDAVLSSLGQNGLCYKRKLEKPYEIGFYMTSSTAGSSVTDNGPAFFKALAYLENHYHIKHIWISEYNSWANTLIEQLHFEVQQAIFEACIGDNFKWSTIAYSAFWAEWVTIKHRIGCSHYFAVTGTHPLLLINIAEANYLSPPPDSILSTTDLIARWAITLQKCHDQLSIKFTQLGFRQKSSLNISTKTLLMITTSSLVT